jgi:flagellar biosynthesis/type III secretory pathway protein FliH
MEVNPLLKFRQWIAEPLLERLRREFEVETTGRQAEAYRLGHESGFVKGQAVGQLQGQQHLLNEFTRFMDERRAGTYEVTPEDITRAKKGLLH